MQVNCKDRKGLLSDVVSALKAFPVVICTAAITTTKDGKVHDVFEVSRRPDCMPQAGITQPTVTCLLMHATAVAVAVTAACCCCCCVCLLLSQVRMEDGSVSAEDIQCAVQQALFAAAARSKRLRREDSAGLMQG